MRCLLCNHPHAPYNYTMRLLLPSRVARTSEQVVPYWLCSVCRDVPNRSAMVRTALHQRGQAPTRDQ